MIHVLKNLTLPALATGAALGVMMSGAHSMEPTVVELTQTPCQIVEVEEKDFNFTSSQKSDCVTINEKTAGERLQKAKVLKLKPGKYVFRVSNKNVGYDLGFWIRGASVVGRATLPSVSGGGLSTGSFKDYAITLKPGEYVYSCPLNSTPDYSLVVEDS